MEICFPRIISQAPSVMTGDAIDRVSDQPGPAGQSEAATTVILIMIQEICLGLDVASELNILSELAPLVVDTETYVCHAAKTRAL